jgi:hypothetical protein
MATTFDIETLFEGSTIIVKQVNVAAAAGDETAAEQSIIDLSALVGPDGLGNTTQEVTGAVSLMEASWSLSPVWEGAKLYWHDEGNDSVILNMHGDSAISYRGLGGKHYGVETEAGDGDVLLDLTNAEEAAGSALVVLVFKKKP